jgi:hypothetical protein
MFGETSARMRLVADQTGQTDLQDVSTVTGDEIPGWPPISIYLDSCPRSAERATRTSIDSSSPSLDQ